MQSSSKKTVAQNLYLCPSLCSVDLSTQQHLFCLCRSTQRLPDLSRFIQHFRHCSSSYFTALTPSDHRCEEYQHQPVSVNYPIIRQDTQPRTFTGKSRANFNLNQFSEYQEVTSYYQLIKGLTSSAVSLRDA